MHKAVVDTNIFLRILIKDDDKKANNCINFIRTANQNGISLYLPPIVILEIVFVLERMYKLAKSEIGKLIEGILNTPNLKCEMRDIFRNAIQIYVEKNIKFADAVIALWAIDKEITTIYTYDEKDFRKIEGIDVKKP